jgi:4-amino-4-deoxy-L-arabinose transferase-like glycosyltransferase
MDQFPLRDKQKAALRFPAEGKTLVLILASLVLRFVFAGTTGLGVDETYTVATSRELALSAFDHPPMAWWLTHAAAKLFGESDLALRAPFLLLFVLTSWLMFALTRRLFGAEAGFYATLALNLAPALGLADASWILPDAPLLPALLACAYALTRIFFGEETRRAPLWWALFGVYAGLALLSKYHALFFLAGVGLVMLTSARQRRWLATPWPWLAGLVAALLFSPALIWNAEHHWVSFLFQSGRSGQAHLNLVAPLVLIGLQSLFFAPWIFLPLAALFLRSLARGPVFEKDWFLACLGGLPIILFTVVALWSSRRVLPHWVGPGYLMILPLLGREIAERMERGAPWLRRGLVAASAFMVAGVGLIAALPRLAPPSLAGARYPLVEMLDWNDFARAVAARGLNQPKTFVAAARWLDAGKIDYALRGAMPVLCLSDDPRGFGVTRDPGDFVGWDALIAAPGMSLEEARQRFGVHFDAIEPLEPIDILAGGKPAITLHIFRATNFHDPAPEYSLRPRRQG